MLNAYEICAIGERIDRLMTVEMRPLSGGLPSNYVVPLYNACRRHHGQPLSSLAALRLTGKLAAGGVVFIATGAGVGPNLPHGETDGPVGAGALAYALIKLFGARIVFVTEDAHRAPVDAVAAAINAEISPAFPATTECFPLGLAAGVEFANQLVEEYGPAVVVFVERDGPNKEGFFHGVRGDCRAPDDVGHVYLLAEIASDSGYLTIGIGDGGNEVGFGAIRDAVTSVHPLGARSNAGHVSGVVTRVATDVVVSASVSNWGAYAIAAALAAILNRPDALYSATFDRRLLQGCVDAGARDGATARQEAAVDGIDGKGQAAFLDMLRSIVRVSI